MEYLEICERLKALIPRLHSNLSEQETISEISCVNGLVTITTPYSFSDDESITITGSSLDYDNSGLSGEFFNYNHEVNSVGEYTIEPTFINLTSSTQCVLHHSIRISLVANEERAFNIFKQNPKDHIFIIPNYINNSNSTGDYNNNADYLHLNNSFLILVYLYDKNDLAQQNNLIEALEIMGSVIAILHNHKLTQQSETISFNKSEFVFSTENSTVLKGEFNFNLTFNNNTNDVKSEIVKTDFGYNLGFINPNLETDELEKD